MSTTQQMLDAYPADLGGVDKARLVACIDACVDCAQVCTACADACLSEEMVDELRKCIRTDLDCADICATTARVLSRHTGYDANISRSMLQACATACNACDDGAVATPACTSTAASAPTPAAPASRPATTC